MILLLSTFLLILFQVDCYGTINNNIEKVENFEILYKQGQEAYLENDFKLCVVKMEAALIDYKHYTKVISTCKLECHQKTQSKQTVVKHILEMMPFEKLIQETLCLMKCKEHHFSRNREEYASAATRSDFEKKKPYDYLQICYYQTGQHQKAANAAYTNHVYNTDYQTMRDNLNFYKNLPEVNTDKIIDIEEEDYVKMYFKGTDLYDEKNWKFMVIEMENALKTYYLAEETCRIECDKPFDMGWYPDFKSSVANHFTFCLKCKMNCASTLNNFRGEIIDNLVPTFYHYLQFGYYNIGNMNEAARCAATYLYMMPDSKEMKDNVDYYKFEEKVEEKWFQPRPEAINYVYRDNDEEALLTFIEDEFIFKRDVNPETEDGSNLASDNFLAQWSEEHGKYILDEKNSENKLVRQSDSSVSPPPIVRFSW